MLGLQFEVTVVDVQGSGCARYRVGDKFVFRNNGFGAQGSTVDVFCMHSMNRIYGSVMQLWNTGGVGDIVRVPCTKDCLCTFEIKLTYVEQPEAFLPMWSPAHRPARKQGLK